MGRATAAAAALPVLLVALCAAGVAGIERAEVKAFVVERVTKEGSVSVERGNYKCTLSYTTDPAAQGSEGGVAIADPAAGKKKEEAEAGAELSEQEMMLETEKIIRELKGCVSTTEKYWTYELCFGRGLTQTHTSEKNDLGTYKKTTNNVQYYDDGTPCLGTPGRAPRSSEVWYYCSMKPRLVEPVEFSMCKYRFKVGHPRVCKRRGISNLPQNFDSRQSGGSKSSVHSDPEREPWLLEIAETSGGHIMCTAYSTDDLVKKNQGSGLGSSVTRFATMALQVERMRSGADESPLTAARAVARGPGRDVTPQQYIMVHKPESPTLPVVMSTSQEFAGPLEYVRMEVETQK